MAQTARNGSVSSERSVYDARSAGSAAPVRGSREPGRKQRARVAGRGVDLGLRD
ncbi:hypothetical protein N136_03684, partial [Leifsonia aquatica ATCC 14665]